MLDYMVMTSPATPTAARVKRRKTKQQRGVVIQLNKGQAKRLLTIVKMSDKGTVRDANIRRKVVDACRLAECVCGRAGKP